MDKHENIKGLSKKEFSRLMDEFNGRDRNAFGELYSLFYPEFHHFASKVYCDTNIEADDVLNDIFINIWQNRNLIFEGSDNIKAYIYISIRNSYKNLLTHNKTIRKYHTSLQWNSDRMVAEVAESEAYSIVNHAIDLLPEDCAEVFGKLLEGWSVKEIADRLGMPERTVYSKKSKAVSILRRKLPKEQFVIMLFFSGITFQ